MGSAPSSQPPHPGESSILERVALSPVLLVGAPRSGTTWFQRLLLAHPDCLGGQESHLLVTLDQVLAESRRKLGMDRPHGILTHVDEPSLLDLYRTIWVEVFRGVLSSATATTVLLEKTPDHCLHLELADQLLPESRVVHLIRHPAAVVASLLHASRMPWGRTWAPASVDAASRRWVECVEAAEAARDRFGPDRHLTVRYEDLRIDPKKILETTFDWIGVTIDGEGVRRILDEESAGRGAEIPMAGESTAPVLQEPDGFVPASRPAPLRGRELRRCLRIVGPTMERLGYPKDGTTP